MTKIKSKRIAKTDSPFVCRSCQKILAKNYFLCPGCYKVTCKSCLVQIKGQPICKNCSNEILRSKMTKIIYLCESLSHLVKFVAFSFKETLRGAMANERKRFPIFLKRKLLTIQEAFFLAFSNSETVVPEGINIPVRIDSKIGQNRLDRLLKFVFREIESESLSLQKTIPVEIISPYLVTAEKAKAEIQHFLSLCEVMTKTKSLPNEIRHGISSKSHFFFRGICLKCARSSDAAEYFKWPCDTGG